MSWSTPRVRRRSPFSNRGPRKAPTQGNDMTNEDSGANYGSSGQDGAGSPRPRARPDELIQFVPTKGTQVAGRRRDKLERIAETVCDLELACEGAFSRAQRAARDDRGRWGAALARACSVFLRKMVIGDRDDPSTRLLDDRVVETLGIGFDRIRRITCERRGIELRQSVRGGMMQLDKLNEETLRPEATVSLPVAPHDLNIVIEWPLPGAAGWTSTPTWECPWTIAPVELFDLNPGEKLDCSAWLGQQLVMFDRRGITLKDVNRMVATFEGAHSIDVSRLLQAADEKSKGPFKNPERHVLDNIVVFGMKYTHIVVIECALYLYEMLVDGGHIERLADEKWRLRPSFVTTDPTGFFSANQNWLAFAGGLIIAFGTAERSITHRIRAVGT